MMTEVRGASNAKAQAGAGVDAAPPELADVLRGRPGASPWTSRTRRCARRPSRSPTGCSAARARPRTWCRRRSCACTARSRRGERIESPRAFVSTVVTRLAIDQLRSARARRETLRRRVAARAARHRRRRRPGRARRAGGLARRSPSSSCSRACRPSSAPCSCCTTSSTTATTRSPRSSARARPTPASSPSGRAATWRSAGRASRPRGSSASELAQRFFAAAEEGDLAGLEALLAQDVVLHGDGGGKAPAARAARPRPRRGRADAAGLGARRRAPSGGVTCGAWRSTASPARSLLDREGGVISVMALDIADGQIQAVRSIVNPDKLRHLGPVGDVRRAARGGAARGLKGSRLRPRSSPVRTARRAGGQVHRLPGRTRAAWSPATGQGSRGACSPRSRSRSRPPGSGPGVPAARTR